MVTLFAVAYGIVLHLGAGRVLIRKSATRAIETLLPESFSWKNGFYYFFFNSSFFYNFDSISFSLRSFSQVRSKLMKDTRGEKKVDVITSIYKRVSPCKIFSSFIWLGGTIVYFVCFGLTHALCVSRYYRNDLLELEIGKYIDAGRSTYVWHILSRGRDELDRIFHTRRNL